MDITKIFSENSKIKKWTETFREPKRQLVMGLSGSSKAIALASAFKRQEGKLMVVVSSQNEADQLLANLSDLLPEEVLYDFFADDVAAAEFLFSSIDRKKSRLRTLDFLLGESSGIVVTSFVGLQILLANPQDFSNYHLELEVGQEYQQQTILKKLGQMGYVKVNQVLNPGEFSQRGDILDIYDVLLDQAYRVEFFGDEIDGIRQFDIETQKSLQNITHINLSPLDHQVVTEDDWENGINGLERLLASSSLELASYLTEFLEATKNGYRHHDFAKWLSLFYKQSYTLLDYLSVSNGVLIFDDFQKIMDRKTQFDLDVANLLTSDLETSRGVGQLTYFANTYQNWRTYQPATFFSTFHKGLGNLRFDASHNLTQYAMQEFFNQVPLMIDEAKRYQKNQATVIFQVSSKQDEERLQKMFQEYDFDIHLVQPNELILGEIQLMVGHLSNGFYFADGHLVLITEREIFHRKVRRKIRRQQVSNAERLKDYNELQKGDYVVHQVHGIGQFLGIETLEISGIHRDYVTIQYQNADRISLPVDQIENLSRYVASDGKVPKLNKLNDGRFQKTKAKVTKQVEDIADDLLELYAKRSQQKGFAFSPDGVAQNDFDQDFSYVETEDQLRSIVEIKRDMEKDQPMDRLLVGDVGFGKTEVAMRAAFKAVHDGKQVAVLVPTTVLAQQHFENFQKRFENHGVIVDVLSRFKTKKEQEATLDSVKKGKVDIIIGTHRLLSNDVVFSDLGLIIIDEEQRFGVRHKERLKELKTKVDVLTLTATPIPRTLHMSMLGIRDLSVIETPPTNRYPVQTYVMETNYEMIRSAVLREIDRGGQVFYIYNKVDTIEQKVSELKELIPEAEIGFVHGQMSEIQLENTLLDFIDGVYDVLVATTIVETGVDIANVNTLFIEDADHMGLSTLYQLRGRVGRSNRIAYAYLMYQPDKILSEVSEKRLEAIKGFTELGSGFKIAMRDLSIRGAGNLLGSSQSGFIDSVGFEMYSQLLEEAIAKKQGHTAVRQKGNVELNLQIDAYLPSSYVDDERQKIEIYKRIRELDGREDYEELQEELIDRFGEYPDPVAYLLEIGLVKSYLDSVFAAKVDRKQQQLVVTFEKRASTIFLTQDYFEALANTQLKARISERDGQIEIVFDIRQKKDYDILEALVAFGEKCHEIKARKEQEK